MGREDEFGIDMMKAAAIADHFRKTDSEAEENIAAFYDSIHTYMEAHGPVNFAELETIFRANNFKTHLVAIPSSVVERQNSDALIVDINDLRIRRSVTLVPFVISAVPNKKDAVETLSEMGITYNAKENLRNLRQTGIMVPKAAVGLARPSVTDLRKLGLHVRPYHGQPKGDPRLAKWN